MASSHFPSGGGTFTGSITNTQIAFGSGADTITGGPDLTWDAAALEVVRSVPNFTNTESGDNRVYAVLTADTVHGGVNPYAYSDGTVAPMLLNGIVLGTQTAGVPSVDIVGNGPPDSGYGVAQGKLVFGVANDYATHMLSAYVPVDPAGFVGPGYIGINTEAPVGLLHVVNPINGDTNATNILKAAVVATLEGRTDQTGSLLQAKLTGGAVLMSVSAAGVVQAAGYKSSDGSTGATASGTVISAITVKNGLITAITVA